MNKTGILFVLITLFGVTELASAVCPEKPVSICQIVRENPVVVRAKVASTQRLADEDDPDGVAGWIYHLDVVKDYRNGKSRRLAVMSENTTARISLQTGGEYIVFASPNVEGQLESGNYCDPYSSKIRQEDGAESPGMFAQRETWPAELKKITAFVARLCAQSHLMCLHIWIRNARAIRPGSRTHESPFL